MFIGMLPFISYFVNRFFENYFPLAFIYWLLYNGFYRNYFSLRTAEFKYIMMMSQQVF